MAEDTVKIVIKTVDESSREVRQAETGFSKFGSTVAGLVTAGAVLAIGSQVAQFGKQAILAASDVEEMQSKFNTVFGSEANSVTAQLQDFADAANRSVYDLQGFAATLQDTFVPLGFARDQAAEMSVNVVKLAEDLASFNNLPTQQVVEDLQSALVGNTETLRKYGVVAQVVQQEQYALNNGIWDGEGAMTAQEKAAAILGITMAGTTDAQGDAIRTAGGFANQMKGLESAVKDVTVGIGQGLLPVATETVGVLTQLVKGTDEAVGAFKSLGESLAGTSFTFDNLWTEAVREALAPVTAGIRTTEAFGRAVQELGWNALVPVAGQMALVSQANEEFNQMVGEGRIEVITSLPVFDDWAAALAEVTSEERELIEAEIDKKAIMADIAAEQEEARSTAAAYAVTIAGLTGNSIKPYNVATAEAEAITQSLAEAYGVEWPAAVAGAGDGFDDAEEDVRSVHDIIAEAHTQMTNLIAAWDAFAASPSITKYVSIVGEEAFGPDGVPVAPTNNNSASGTSSTSGTLIPDDVGADGTPGSTLPGGGDQLPNGPVQPRGFGGGNTIININGPAATSPAAMGSNAFGAFPRG